MTVRASTRRLPALRTAMWLAFAAILVAPLLAPVLAPRFTRGVDWTGHDVAAAAALLATLDLAVEAATRLLRRPRARVLVIGIAVVATALVWAEGAVGIFP